MNRTVLTVAAAALLAAASPAKAKSAASHSSSSSSSSGGSGLSSISVWGVFDAGPVDGVGVGLRLALPLAPQGLLHAKIKDELVLEFGSDFVHYSDRVGYPGFYESYDFNGLLLVGGVAWNFWFTPQLALYPKLDLGWWLGWYSGWYDRYGYAHHDFDGLFVQGAVGLIYRLPKVDLRVELGSGLLRLGVGFPF
jgi:hypothetical protein